MLEAQSSPLAVGFFGLFRHRRCKLFWGPDEALYNVGGGQWHYEMGFSDPYFGSTQTMVSAYYAQLGKNPTYDGAACMAAGNLVDVVEGSQRHGMSWSVACSWGAFGNVEIESGHRLRKIVS